jgi:hypothetical protein
MEFLHSIVKTLDYKHFVGAISSINSQGELQTPYQHPLFVKGGIRPITASGNMANSMPNTVNNKPKVEIVYDLENYEED